MLAQQYAQALYEATKDAAKEKRESYFNNFMKIIEHNKHQYLLQTITKKYEGLVTADKKKKTVTIVSAKELSEEEERNVLQKAHITSEAKRTHSIDESLIGGVQVLFHDKHYDSSYKTQLLKLYDTLTQV